MTLLPPTMTRAGPGGVAAAAAASPPQRCRVVVIGAGPSGLVTARHLLDAGGLDARDLVVVEECDRVGGLWNQIERAREDWPGVSEEGAASMPATPAAAAAATAAGDPATLAALQKRVEFSCQPVYTDLRTNLPKEWMAFNDFPYDPRDDIIPTPPTVQAYYEAYTAHFNLSRVILFNTRAVQCAKTGDGRWRVDTVTVDRHKNWAVDNTRDARVFEADHLVVCSGHLRRGYVPWDTPGLAAFPGRIQHSSAFTKVGDYAGLSVLVVGGAASGGDIAGMLATAGCCKRVAICVRGMNQKYKVLCKKALNAGRQPGTPGKAGVLHVGLRQIHADGRVEFDDDPAKAMGCDLAETPVEHPDVIIFATGYLYDTTFVEVPTAPVETCGQARTPPLPHFNPTGVKMANLYLRMFYAYDASLVFIGVTNDNFSPAMVFEYQALVLARVVRGDVALPSLPAMLEEVESRAADVTCDRLQLACPAYCNALAAVAGVPGYWTQLLGRRARWLLAAVYQRHPAKMVAAVTLLAVVSSLGAWLAARGVRRLPAAARVLLNAVVKRVVGAGAGAGEARDP